MAQLPSKLKYDIIGQAIFELCFEPNLPNEAVFGIVYPIVLKRFPDWEHISLPLAQLPEIVRNNNEQFKYQPQNKLQGDNLSIGIGPRVVSFFIDRPYIGWKNWKPHIMDILNDLCDSHLIKNVRRTSLQYFNLTERGIFQITDAVIKIINCTTKPISTAAKIEMPGEDDYIKALKFVNNIPIEKKGQKEEKSLVNIEIYRNKIIESDDFKINLETILEKSHAMEKDLFFNSLRKDFVDELGPVYD
jgi:uncharacterized protein (TIGR04255 family)